MSEKRAPQPVLDAVSALVNLGYGQPQAAAAIAAASRDAGEGAGDRAADPAGAEGAERSEGQIIMLSDADRKLIEAASEAIRLRYRQDWQEVGAALRLRSGKVFTGVSLDAYLGRMAVCAEAVALGQAVTQGEAGIDTIVAVRHPAPDEKSRRHRRGVAMRRLPRIASGTTIAMHASSCQGRAGRSPSASASFCPNKYSRERAT